MTHQVRHVQRYRTTDRPICWIGPPLTWKQHHSVGGVELAALPIPADLGRGDGVALAGQADGVSQDHLRLLRHVPVVVVVSVVLLVPESPGRLSVGHPLKHRGHWWPENGLHQCLKPVLSNCISLLRSHNSRTTMLLKSIICHN